MPIHISIFAHIKIIVPGPVYTRSMFAVAESHTFAALGGLDTANGFALAGFMPGLCPIVSATDLCFSPVAVRISILFSFERCPFIVTRVMRLTVLAVVIRMSGPVFPLMIGSISIIV
jgi:hypothetical protein